jgi:hypothetical protein
MANTATPYLLSFGRAGMVAHPNRLLASANELVVAQNAAFDRDSAHRPVTFEYYDPIGLSGQVFAGTWGGGGVIWSGVVAGYAAASDAAFVGDVGEASASAQTSPWTFTVGGSASVGQLAVLSIGFRFGTLAVTSVVDSKGNTWVRSAYTSTGPSVEQWASVLTVALAPSDTITVTFTGPASNVTAVLEAYSGVSIAASVGWAWNEGSTSAVSVTCSYLLSYPVLLVGSVACFADIATRPLTPSGSYVLREATEIAGNMSLNQCSQPVVVRGPQIVAQYDWIAAAESTSTGTSTTAANSVAINGSGTTYLTEFVPGDEIIISGEVQRVARITQSDVAEAEETWSAALSGTAKRRSGPTVITAALDGKLYKEYPRVDSGSPETNRGLLGDTVLKSGLNTSFRRGRFVVGGKESSGNDRKLFYLNGTNPIQVLAGDAATTSDIATPAADWGSTTDPTKQPLNAIVHRDRLVAFGNLNDPHRIYLSSADDHEQFLGGTSLSIRIASQIGERLYGAATFRGVLFVWKYPKGIFYLDDTAIDYASWSYRAHSEAVGCAPSPHAIIPLDDDVLFVDPNGHLHLLSAVDTLGGVQDSDLTRRLGLQAWVAETIDRSSLATMAAVYNPATKTVYIGCRSKTAPTFSNDLLLMLDFSGRERDIPVRFSYATAYTPNSLTLKRRDSVGEQAVLLGEFSTSYLARVEEYGARIEIDPGESVDPGARPAGRTVGYAQVLTTPELDLGDAAPELRTRRKNFGALELILADEDLAIELCTLEVRVDGVLRETQTFTTATRRVLRQLSVGDGHTIQFTLRTTGAAAADVRFLAAVLYYSPAGHDASRRS